MPKHVQARAAQDEREEHRIHKLARSHHGSAHTVLALLKVGTKVRKFLLFAYPGDTSIKKSPFPSF